MRPDRGSAGPGRFLGRVPSPPGRFVGRPAEFGCIRTAVLQPRSRVAVVGMGGAGKSALVAKVAHDDTVAKRFHQGMRGST